jgi:hypothetical protein
MSMRAAKLLIGLAALVSLAGSNLLRDPSFEDAQLTNWQQWCYQIEVMRDDDKKAPDLDKSFYAPSFSTSTPYWDQESGGTAGAAGQVDGQYWKKFRAGFYQIVNVAPGACVRSSVWANEFCQDGMGWSYPILLRAGIDPSGGTDWQSQQVQWVEMTISNSTYVSLTVPLAVVGSQGKVTVFTWGEPLYPVLHSAAFFDEAQLVVLDACERVFLPIILRSSP